MDRVADRLLGGVLLVRSLWEHSGAAASLIHDLKYRAVLGIAGDLAPELAERLGVDATCLVPVPRTALRRLRYGVDPSLEIAKAISRHSGLPLVSALRAPLWARRRAGVGRAQRGPVRFGGTIAPSGAVLVDDVITTGATLLAASGVTGARRAVTVTAAVGPSV